MFINDRDLLVLEPNLFRDVGWLGQRLADTTGSISGTTLTVTGADLAALGVGAGYVALVNGLPVEVLARLSATTATVSRLRADVNDAAIPPGNVPPSVPVQVWTLRPQINVVHQQVLRLLGIEPSADGGPVLPWQLTEAQIIRPRSLWLLEALLTLHLVYSSAAALAGSESPLGLRAQMYLARAGAERARAVAYLDTNGDGVAEVARYVGVACWVRG